MLDQGIPYPRRLLLAYRRGQLWWVAGFIPLPLRIQLTPNCLTVLAARDPARPLCSEPRAIMSKPRIIIYELLNDERFFDYWLKSVDWTSVVPQSCVAFRVVVAHLICLHFNVNQKIYFFNLGSNDTFNCD